jgi:hypothetical protein
MGDGDLLEVLVWRLATGSRSVVIGATRDLGDGERIWFRVLDGDRGDRVHRDPAVAEVRTGERARERAESATALYRGKRWRVVDGPRQVLVPVPGITDRDVLAGAPLAEWARGLAASFASGEI